ncbi:hypothetical protein BN2476_70008 [Paraburkholderia piptadeniae]|uniref:Uncharacterized protein n=1 Tax=Paraburkholderia piptadeniae TaxID=1701573 RepID=A0A1N7RL33_9BURK|nr:hypothetical protein [Paraburkholderia piptadeniae]SIT35821.1 hypothetical protein BN2476_70008 [Paraburkholderia piptadeniae]
MTEAKLYDRSFSEGYEAGFAGRARECPYNASKGMYDEDQWHAGYLYGQHVAIMQHLQTGARPHHTPAVGADSAWPGWIWSVPLGVVGWLGIHARFMITRRSRLRSTG